MYKKYEIFMTEEIRYILKILNKYSNSYIVGGYIRDRLLNICPKDCDFSTSLSLKEMLKIFSDSTKFKVEIISVKLNIIQLKYKNNKFEIARMRKDLMYNKNRKDFLFSFVENIEEDLPRRDFSINSLAYDGENLFFLDESIFQDIENKRIKFLGNVEKRIIEDPFRILRLFRFFSEKSLLEIDDLTLKIIKKNKKLIWNLSTEMIQGELIRIIKGDNYLETFKYINYVNLFDEIFDTSTYYNNYFERVKSLFLNSDLNLLEKLNFSNKMIKRLKIK